MIVSRRCVRSAVLSATGAAGWRTSFRRRARSTSRKRERRITGDAELATDDEAAILLWNAFMTGDPVAQRAMRLLAAFSAGELAWVVGVGLGLEKPWTWDDFADHFKQWKAEEE